MLSLNYFNECNLYEKITNVWGVFLADGALKADEKVVTSVHKQKNTASLYPHAIKTKKRKINRSATAVCLHSPLKPMMIQFFFYIQYCWHQTLYEDVKVCLLFSMIQGFGVFQICTFCFYLHFRRHGNRACHFSLTTVFGNQLTSPLRSVLNIVKASVACILFTL